MNGLFRGDLKLLTEKHQIEKMLLHSLRLNPDDKFTKQRLANLYFIVFKDYEKARDYFEQALPEAYSHYFYAQFLLAMGQFEQAHHQINLHIKKYPSEYSKEAVAWIYTMDRQYDKALSEILKLQQYADDNFYFHVSLQAIYELTGDHKKAFQQLLWLMHEVGYTQDDLQQVKTIFNTQQLAGVYNWLAFTDSKQLPIGQYTPPLSLARYAISAGKQAQALTWLEEAFIQQQPALLWLAADPKYDPLHKHPRFIALIKTLKLTNLNKNQ